MILTILFAILGNAILIEKNKKQMEKTLRAFQFSKLKTRLDIQCKHISKLSEICKEILLKAKLIPCNQKC